MLVVLILIDGANNYGVDFHSSGDFSGSGGFHGSCGGFHGSFISSRWWLFHWWW